MRKAYSKAKKPCLWEKVQQPKQVEPDGVAMVWSSLRASKLNLLQRSETREKWMNVLFEENQEENNISTLSYHWSFGNKYCVAVLCNQTEGSGTLEDYNRLTPFQANKSN